MERCNVERIVQNLIARSILHYLFLALSVALSGANFLIGSRTKCFDTQTIIFVHFSREPQLSNERRDCIIVLAKIGVNLKTFSISH